MNESALYRALSNTFTPLTKYRVGAYICFLAKFLYHIIIKRDLLTLIKKWSILPESDEYYIYISESARTLTLTLPHMFTHNKPSFVWIERNKQINPEYMPEHVNYLTSKQITIFHAQFAVRKVLKNFKKRLKTQPDLMINVFTGAPKIIYQVHKMKLPANNYKLIFNDSGELLIEELTHSMSRAKNFADELDYVSSFFKRMFSYFEPVLMKEKIRSYFFFAAMSIVVENFEVWTPNAELIDNFPAPPDFTPELLEKKKKIKTKNVSDEDIYRQLTDNQKEQLFSALSLDKSVYNGLFLNADKPCLIIIGVTEEHSHNFEANMELAAKKYSGEYKLFYKPHPSPHRNNTVLPQRISQKYGIHVLPGQIPIQFILLRYPQIVIGGYLSSSLFAVRKDRIKFVIADKNAYNYDKSISHNERMKLISTREAYRMIYTVFVDGTYPDVEVIWA